VAVCALAAPLNRSAAASVPNLKIFETMLPPASVAPPVTASTSDDNADFARGFREIAMAHVLGASLALTTKCHVLVRDFASAETA
jgi:hypothetical protein